MIYLTHFKQYAKSIHQIIHERNVNMYKKTRNILFLIYRKNFFTLLAITFAVCPFNSYQTPSTKKSDNI